MAYLVGDREQAERHLLAAIQAQPDAPGFLYTYAIFCRDTGQRTKAITAAERLKELAPENAAFEQLRRELQTSQGPKAGPIGPAGPSILPAPAPGS
jgi:hypothetical protein